MAAIKHVSTGAKLMEGFKIEVYAGKHNLFIDQPTAGGGTDSGPSPLDYLQFALSGCILTIGRIIASQRKIELRNMTARVEGDLDLDILRGKSTDGRAGFTSLKVYVDIDADMTQEEKESFLEEVDRRCPISDNLIRTTPIEFMVEEMEPVSA